MNVVEIDITFDVRADSKGKDPDYASKTLRSYHQLLWSKQLPNGQFMKLEVAKNGYLRWRDFYFGSDSIIVSFMNARYKLRNKVEHDILEYPQYRENYLRKSYTIAGSVIFPQVKWSMNQARGCSPKICDRWDLTLECIRRFYNGESSPLDTAFQRSKEFFELFVDFKGYVDFFFFQDCVDENLNVKLWLDTPLFVSNPMPPSVESYISWINKELDFVDKRGKRIKDYCCLVSHL
ncbi:MAG: hypothetical protein J6U14_08385 [Bacteroidaceae bacterium]|nr:hypothetical protein [Bacteroidaceae bacterium]